MDQEAYTADRRDEAKQHRGVWYDARADKFAAEVYSRGDRHFLGHFPTAADAATAYAAARLDLPSGRTGEDTFVSAFQTFLDSAKRDAKGGPLVDEVLTYKGQQFTFEGVVFRRIGGKSRPFYNWMSDCKDCRTPYETLTATSPSMAKGITRTCEKHRARKPAAKAQSAQGEMADVPQAWIDIANTVADDLSVVADAFDYEAFLAECKRRDPALPRPFLRYLLNDARSPVVSRDERLHLRNT